MFKTFKQHIIRSPYQSMAAILVVSLSLFLISVFFLLGVGSQTVLQYFESRPQLIAYLKDEARPQDVEVIIAKIKATGKAKQIDYVSKEKALEIYKQLFKDKPLLLEMVTAKILPASIEISPYNLSSIQELATMLKKEPLVEDLDFEEDVVKNLAGFIVSLRKIGLVMAAVLLFIAVLTVVVVLGMRISKRKEEMEILKLLGASPWYIRFPLYLEGIFYGLTAAVLSWGLTYLIILYSTPFLTSFFAGIPLFPVPLIFMLEILAGLLILGTVVGFLGSFLAILRSAKTAR
ncbi:MAG: cell division protein FtsX [Microgenomates group bacterium]